MGLLQHEGRRSIVLFSLLSLGRKLVQLVKPHSYFNALQLIPELQVLGCLLRLHAQRLQLQFQFGNLIADTHQVIFRMGKFPLSLLFAVTVLGNTGSFFKNFTAVSALQRQNFINSALADIGIAFFAQTGVHKHFVDVTQTGRLAVDIVFTITAAVIPTRNHNLVGIVRQSAIGIVQDQSCLGKANGSSFLRTAKDHVLHLRATESLGALLTHNPQNSIGNIGFTGAVGANDGSNIVAKTNQCFIGEGLKALHLQRFQIHSKNLLLKS